MFCLMYPFLIHKTLHKHNHYFDLGLRIYALTLKTGSRYYMVKTKGSQGVATRDKQAYQMNLFSTNISLRIIGINLISCDSKYLPPKHHKQIGFRWSKFTSSQNFID